MDDIFRGFGVEIKLKANESLLTTNPQEYYKDAFLKVRETLTRIGISSKKEKVLYQSVHILHKRGRYALLHFKELFAFDGKPFSFSDEDRLRRNKIVALLGEWGLITILENEKIKDQAPLSHVKIIHHGEKKDWKLVAKYDVGSKRRLNDNQCTRNPTERKQER